MGNRRRHHERYRGSPGAESVIRGPRVDLARLGKMSIDAEYVLPRNRGMRQSEPNILQQRGANRGQYALDSGKLGVGSFRVTGQAVP